MTKDRELKFVLKVKDEGSASLKKVSLEFTDLAQAEQQAQTESAGLNRSFGILDRQVGVLTGSLTSLDQKTEEASAVISDFKKGVNTGLKESIEDMSDWVRTGEDLAVSMTQNMASAFDDIFFAAVKGNFDDIESVWQCTLNNMLRAFTAFAAQIAAAWTLNQLADTFGLSFLYPAIPGQSMMLGGGGSNLLGAAAAGYGAYSLFGGGGAIAPGMMAVETASGGITAANIGVAGGNTGLWTSIAPYAPYAAGALAGWYLLDQTGIGTTLVEGAQDILEEIPLVGGVASDIVGGIGNLLGFQYGTAFVPETTPAIVHKGERILSAEHNERLVRAVESGTGGMIINSPLINVEGSLVADETTLDRFAEEIDVRLRKLAERRF
ncbi:MAG: hypothetical protein JRJ73_08650 [Deltaproteobacteria bacterium]|nr:hypothetical protein [Deltaproteobacteria bacterium]MBW2052931.1 hypothetical protein [Deltaproteobacteria bacterium]